MGETFDYKEREWAEIELVTSGIDCYVKTFDYSDQEWAEIELSAQPARKGPLMDDERQRLRRASSKYLLLRSTGRKFLKRQERTEIANRQNIRELAAELHEALVHFNATEGKYNRILKSLAKLRNDASIVSATSPPLSPREDFYGEIFGIWVDKLGGRLGVSRHAGSHKLGGPLVRFFQAVTRPVMSTEVPAVESISEIVDREKERRKSCRRAVGRVAAQAGGFIEEGTLSSDGSGDYTDLGPFQIHPAVPFEKQLHRYLVVRGRDTGVLHMVALDAEGAVLAHGFGKRNSIGMPNKLHDALNDPVKNIVLHLSNHQACLNPVDVARLGYPGLDALWRHGHCGDAVRVSLTSEARAMLRGSTSVGAMETLYRLTGDILWPLYDVLQPAVRAGKISAYQANMVHGHAVGLALHQAGILDYRWEVL